MLVKEVLSKVDKTTVIEIWKAGEFLFLGEKGKLKSYANMQLLEVVTIEAKENYLCIHTRHKKERCIQKIK